MRSTATKVNPINIVEEVSRLVQKESGVQLGIRQSPMVKSQLLKRIAELKLRDPMDYYNYLQKNIKSETGILVSMLTTHHTFFFREYRHFEYLEKTGLPRVIAALRKKGEKKIKVWSAACSKGQEVYSLAMFLDHHLRKLAPDFNFEILGSDIDGESVRAAQNGVYTWQEIKEIPLAYIGRHWSRGTGEISKFVRVNPSLKEKCRFEKANLLDLPGQFENFDIIFCRNVFIYFNSSQIKNVTTRLMDHLNPHGLLFLGLSESLLGSGLKVHSLDHSIYAHLPAAGELAPLNVLPPSPGPSARRIWKVLCVDDSPVIIALLKKILTPDQGFEIVDVATNGQEAAEKVRQHRVDVMTLDIHMPVMDGITYLKKHFDSMHPPVVMISSISRDDAKLGLGALDLGARDFVEKPRLSNFEERADEIRTKLQCAIASGEKDLDWRGARKLTKSFVSRSRAENLEGKVRVVLAGLSDREKLYKFVGDLQGAQPPTVIFFQGVENMLDEIVSSLKTKTNLPVGSLPSDMAVQASFIYVADFSNSFQRLEATMAGRKASFVILGELTKKNLQKISRWKKSQVVLEESAMRFFKDVEGLEKIVNDIVPSTSLLYCSDHFLSEDDHE